MSFQVFVEGGGNKKALKAACREGFRKFIENAGLAGNMPVVVPCGARGDAYNDFRAAHAAGEAAILLVDAEGPVTAPDPWQHLNSTPDNWVRPAVATDNQCHLMVQVMESWFLADVDALRSFYGQGFRPQDLPPNPDIERVPKADVLAGLAQATRNTKSYKKGSDSFQILGNLDPAKVRTASAYADRFVRALSSPAP